MFSCEFCEISKNTFFAEHLRTTASEHSYALFEIWMNRLSLFFLKRCTFLYVLIAEGTCLLDLTFTKIFLVLDMLDVVFLVSALLRKVYESKPITKIINFLMRTDDV